MEDEVNTEQQGRNKLEEKINQFINVMSKIVSFTTHSNTCLNNSRKHQQLDDHYQPKSKKRRKLDMDTSTPKDHGRNIYREQQQPESPIDFYDRDLPVIGDDNENSNLSGGCENISPTGVSGDLDVMEVTPAKTETSSQTARKLAGGADNLSDAAFDSGLLDRSRSSPELRPLRMNCLYKDIPREEVVITDPAMEVVTSSPQEGR